MPNTRKQVWWVMTLLSLCIGCAAGEQTTADDFTRGSGPSNGSISTPSAGTEPTSESNTEACGNHTDCSRGERCDFTFGICISNQEMSSDSNDAFVLRPRDMGVTPPMENQDANVEDATGACSTRTDTRTIQGGIVCLSDCDDAYEAASERCEQTPSRIADCLAEASQTRDRCKLACQDLRSLIVDCATGCVQSNDVAQCGLDCFGEGVALSEDCVICFENTFECTGQFCEGLCLNGGITCADCIEQNCGSTFQQCSGIPLP